jgi:hypothetical protein
MSRHPAAKKMSLFAEKRVDWNLSGCLRISIAALPLTTKNAVCVFSMLRSDYFAGTFRDVEHVAPEEIQRMMPLIVEHALGIKSEALFQETARVLGFQRTGDRIRENLVKNFRSLLRAELIYQNGDLISIRPS